MLEQKIRSELDRTTGPVHSGGGDVEGVMRRGRLLRRRLVLARGGVAVLVAVAAVGLGSVLDRAVPDQPSSVADGVAEPGSINVLPGLDIPIDGAMESFGSYTVYRGRVGPAPDFAPDGYELPLMVREEIVLPAQLLDRGDVVYAGTVVDVDVYLQPLSSGDGGLLGFIDRVFDGPDEAGLGFIAWHPATESYSAGQLLGASRPTGPIGGPLINVEVIESGAAPPPRPSFYEGLAEFLAWPATPEGTSVVLLLLNGEPVAWQRPVAGTAIFLLPENTISADLQMVAFAFDGSVIEAVGG
jgi:hypothetical protein